MFRYCSSDVCSLSGLSSAIVSRGPKQTLGLAFLFRGATHFPPSWCRGLRMRQGSLGRHPGGLQKASRPLLLSHGLRWVSDGPPIGLGWPQMGVGWVSDSLGWASDGPWMGLRWAAERLRCCWNGVQWVSEHFIGLQYAFELQKVSAAVQIISVRRRQRQFTV